jgi:hypothetical protein
LRDGLAERAGCSLLARSLALAGISDCCSVASQLKQHKY